MKKKKVQIASMSPKTARSIRSQLNAFFRGEVEVNCFLVDDCADILIDCDLLAFTSSLARSIFLSRRSVHIDSMVLSRVIRSDSVEKLLTVAPKTDVLLVNDYPHTCQTVIRQLQDCGLGHITYHPFYPGVEHYKPLEIAVTPGEPHLVPSCVKTVIDIGTRQMDMTNLAEILVRLNMMDRYRARISSHAYRDLVNVSKNIISKAHQTSRLRTMLTSMINNLADGVLYTNASGQIIVFNNAAARMLGTGGNEILNRNLYEICPSLSRDIVVLSGKEIYVRRECIGGSETEPAYLVTLRMAEEIERLGEQLRRSRKTSETGARYTFSNLIGTSQENRRLIALSQKLARSSSTVLIQGESGTGKEILSQAIHNASARSTGPFVAVNFAALSPTLLESELFGYEEGAFTGAKKGGRVGLFKRAHGGTIFLDEIGDMPLPFQASLLRVIQEREIAPIGGGDPIPIDIRIIAATNRKLIQMVKQGLFREDLYYRLNVMPVFTVPLRQRPDDIPALLAHFLGRFLPGCAMDKFFSSEALSFLLAYRWPGNVRELENMVEYLSNVQEPGSPVCVRDLLQIIGQEDTLLDSPHPLKQDTLSQEALWVLASVAAAPGAGRRQLAAEAARQGYSLGEGRIRGLLHLLADRGYLALHRGARGTELLPAGIEALQKRECNALLMGKG